MTFFVEHIGLAANNTTALKDWYVSMLGATLVYSDGKTPPAYFLQLPGGPLIEIYAADRSIEETGNNKLAGWRHLALRVDSLEKVRAELTTRGVAFIDPVKPAGGGGRILFFKDGEGNLLHLTERPAESAFNSR